ncbi:DUF2524 family protein [Bacillus suaedae]|uniref:DUF2524 family protein n=1 Tax=Halalkalibacter suaedae TaxID=2822140 RepID=A0A940WTJ2_9BACI|nr:DUF2524 family protein [Bacillus suaedae]MBP3950372.1 DUF2524 family protein [Bacillus suaedae]
MPTEFETILARVRETIDQALTEYQEASMIRENDVTEYSFAQNQLNDLKVEIDKLVENFPPEQRTQELLDAQQKLEDVQELLDQ